MMSAAPGLSTEDGAARTFALSLRRGDRVIVMVKTASGAPLPSEKAVAGREKAHFSTATPVRLTIGNKRERDEKGNRNKLILELRAYLPVVKG